MQYILWSTDSDKGDFGLSEVGKNKKIKTVGSIFFLVGDIEIFYD